MSHMLFQAKYSHKKPRMPRSQKLYANLHAYVHRSKCEFARKKLEDTYQLSTINFRQEFGGDRRGMTSGELKDRYRYGGAPEF